MDSHQFKLLTPLLLSLFLVLPLALATDVHYCDKKTDYDVKVNGVEISPNPIARGSPATFNISATADKQISGGKVVIDVSYFGWRIQVKLKNNAPKHPVPFRSWLVFSYDDYVQRRQQEAILHWLQFRYRIRIISG